MATTSEILQSEVPDQSAFAGNRKKVAAHLTLNEPLLFEKSSPGKCGYRMPPLDVPEVDAAKLLGNAARKESAALPELSEIEIIRHFTRLSTWNYAIDLGMYPLGSCTMKYNPRVNEFVSRLEGIAEAHPYQPESLSQGALGVLRTLEKALIEITGMDTITLQPAAGAHGEFTGILLTRAYHESKGNPRRKVLIPDSAHGTNPATAAVCGYQVENLRSNTHGMVDIEQLAKQVDDQTAALMLTNPSTIGVFESEIHKIADILHAKGALLYMDGANMNALCGKTRPGDFGVDVMHLNLHKTFSTPHGGGGPGSGPVACKKILEPFLPTPVVVQNGDGTLRLDYDRPHSVGRVRMFYGNFGMFVRALAYILANGPDGLRQTTEDAVLNANYIRKKLEGHYELPYKTPSMHEVVFSDKRQQARGVKTGDIAKRLIDYGFHPYTVSFPLIVPGALMIEPTESESKEELDLFIDAMQQIAREVEENPALVLTAPHATRVKRMDETAAARKPILRYKAPPVLHAANSRFRREGVVVPGTNEVAAKAKQAEELWPTRGGNSALAERRDDLEKHEFMLGPERGRLAISLDMLTDALILIGQHGVYCVSNRNPSKPALDLQVVLDQINGAKQLIQSTMAELERKRE